MTALRRLSNFVSSLQALVLIGCVSFIIIDGGTKLHGKVMPHIEEAVTAKAPPQSKVTWPVSVPSTAFADLTAMRLTQPEMVEPPLQKT